jgi:lipopolysaccharide export system protein LptC
MSQARILGTAPPWPAAPRRARRRSRLIGALRILLPTVALLLVGLVIAWPQIMRGTAGLVVPIFAPGDGDQPDMLRMDSPRYVGQTKRNRPYTVTAQSAALDPLAASIVHLERPAANIALGEDGDIRLIALNGTYDRDTDKLLLDGGIEMVTSSGYRFATPSARVNLAQGRVRGWQPIEGEGPTGTLSADRFEIKDAGDILRFEGRVKVTVEPQAGQETPPGEPVTPRSDGGRPS